MPTPYVCWNSYNSLCFAAIITVTLLLTFFGIYVKYANNKRN